MVKCFITNKIFFLQVSHTTHDLVFKWNFTDPLVTNPDIELPQLDIAKNTTEDCTLEYSTGNQKQKIVLVFCCKIML
jgi:hypothetical protein